MSEHNNVLLITGLPGIGKTTVVKKVVQSLSDFHFGGFYTEEIKVNKVRKGFELVTLGGKRFVMAHVDIESSCRVSRYGVNVSDIDTAAEMALSYDQDVDVYIIDEIGKMECFSSNFVQKISTLLDSPTPVVATIALKGGGLISEVKNREGIELWEVTKGNRNAMPADVIGWVMKKFRG